MLRAGSTEGAAIIPLERDLQKMRTLSCNLSSTMKRRARPPEMRQGEAWARSAQGRRRLHAARRGVGEGVLNPGKGL